MIKALLKQNVVHYMLLILSACIGAFLTIYQGFAVGMVWFSLPLLGVGLVYCLQYPFITTLLLYVSIYFILGFTRYVDFAFPVGILIDTLLIFNFAIILIHSFWKKESLGRVQWSLVLFLSLSWMIYCCFLLLNPLTTFSKWTTTVRHIGIYVIAFQLLVFYVFNSINKIHAFIKLWGLLIILAVLKGLGQKFFGFDYGESRWLNDGGSLTHIIHSGVRYFSFFTDSANFGCHMGLAIVFFTILLTQEKNRAILFFYVCVIVLAVFGLFISGTRAAIVVPFVGFSVWVLLVRQWKWFFVGIFGIIVAFIFFNNTTIGNSIDNVRRMRTAFDFKNDASFNVRVENQDKMAVFMPNHPFGIGMGAAKNAVEGDLMANIATDSSFIFIWVETGIVGLILYSLLFGAFIFYGFYYVWKVLKNRFLQTIVVASVSAVCGILAAGYANEVLHQFPTGQTVYILMGFVLVSPVLDKKINHG